MTRKEYVEKRKALVAEAKPTRPRAVSSGSTR